MTLLNSCKCERQAVLAFMQENIQSHARARLTLHINNVTDPARLVLEGRIVLIDFFVTPPSPSQSLLSEKPRSTDP